MRGGKLSSSAAVWVPYCGAAPVPAELLARWNLDPVLLVLIGLATVISLCSSAPRRKARLAGIAIFAFLFVSPFCALGSALFTARVVHHVLLATVLAPLLVQMLALNKRPIPLSLATLTAIQALVFWVWHAPPVYEAALSSDAIFWVMQGTITASAAMWWAKLRQADAGAAVVSLLATMVQMGVLGALLAFAGRAFYAPHYLTSQQWGFSPLEDQQVAGIIMWAPASAIYLLIALTILYRWLSAAGKREVQA